MKEVLSIHLGQCGIQIAGCLWERFLDCLKSSNEDGNIHDAQSFFSWNGSDVNLEYPSNVRNLESHSPRSRCILVDTEIGAISEILQHQPMNHIDSSNVICGTEAAGGNWGTAYYEYGPQYNDTLEELLMKHAEPCDRGLQYFNLIFAIGGGSGAGLGSYLLDMLNEEFHKVPRICNVVTQDSEAAVSPYNVLLCMKHLNDTASIATIFSNEALLKQSAQSTASILRRSNKSVYSDGFGFDNINTLISRHIMDFSLATVARRFPGFNMNAVINTLTPVKDLNIMCPAMVPQHLVNGADCIETFSNELMRPSNRICPVHTSYIRRPIAMAIQGGFDSSSLSCIKRLKLKHNMVGWNRDAIKLSIKSGFGGNENTINDTGMHSLVNDSSISHFLDLNVSNFDRLYSKKAFLHHFTGVVDEEELKTARDHISFLQSCYQEIYESSMVPHQFLDKDSLASLGVRLNPVKNDQYVDLWNNTPATIISDNKRWWELNGHPIV